MLKKLFFVACIGYSLYAPSQGSNQNLNDPILDPSSVIPPSPTVANLIDFESIPVNHYTGQPNITIPLFSKQIHKDLNLNLKLGYSSNGIKINSQSGWVGTGWSLSGLGVVSKTVRGIPDETVRASEKGTWMYPIDEPFDLEQQWKAYSDNGVKWDSQYDIFDAVYPGGSVKFLVKLDSGRILTPHIISSSEKVKIFIGFTDEIDSVYSDSLSCINANRLWREKYNYRSWVLYDFDTELGIWMPKIVEVPAHCNDTDELIKINSFTIIDSSGKRYEFGKYEYSTVTSISGQKLQGYDTEGILQAPISEHSTRSAWHLTGIYAGPTKEAEKLVTIDYNGYFETYQSSREDTENLIDVSLSHITEGQLEIPYNQNILKPKVQYTFFESNAGSARPSKIIFRDSTYIRLNHETSYPHPETGGAVLKSLEKYDRSDNLITTKLFSYDITGERLWLTGIEEFDGENTDLLTHSFDYHQKESLPIFNSPHDIWGFIHQGDGSNTGKAADPIKIGLLSSIEYPTGGKKEFTWEQNRFSYAGNEKFNPITQTEENPNNYAPDSRLASFNETVTVQNFNIYDTVVTIPENIDPSVRLLKFEASALDPNDPQELDEFDTYVKIYNSSGVEVFSESILDLRSSSKSIPSLPAGQYTIKLGSSILGSFNVEFQLSTSFKVLRESTNNSTSVEKWVYGGGPRIKGIKFTDQNQVQRKWNFSYFDEDQAGENYSSGSIDGEFSNYKPEYSIQANYYFAFDDLGGIGQKTVHYTVKSDQVNAKMTQGSYVGYKHVKVSESGKGFTIFRFTSPRSHPSQAPDFVYPFHRDDNVDYQRGVLLNEIQYQQFLVTDTLDFGLVDENGIPIAGSNIVGIPKYFPKTSTTYNYEYETENIESSYLVAPTLQCHTFQFFNSYQSNESATMMVNCPPGLFGLPNCSALAISSCEAPFFVSKIDHVDTWRKLVQKTTKQFEYANDLVSQKSMQIIENYSYNSKNRLISEKTTSYMERGNTVKDMVKYYYSVGPYPSGIFNVDEIANLETNKSLNRIGDIVFVEQSELENNNLGVFTSTVKGQKKVAYNNLIHGVYELSSTASRKNPNDVFQEEIIILRMDEYGNILEYQTLDGISHVHLYGYKGSALVASIDNATYDQVVTSLDISKITDPIRPSGNVDPVKTETEKLRTNLNLDQAFITIYNYDRQMRLAEIIDANEETMTYRYDDFGRLRYVIDDDGNLLEENTYHFRN